MELQKGRRKLATKNDSVQKDNRYADSEEDDDDGTKRKKGKPRRRIINQEDDSDDGAERVKTKKHSKESKKASKSKSSLDYKVLFPKKRKRKEKVGCGISEDPWDARRKPGETAAETNSMYINPSDDSDYVPSDAQSSGMFLILSNDYKYDMK